MNLQPRFTHDALQGTGAHLDEGSRTCRLHALNRIHQHNSSTELKTTVSRDWNGFRDQVGVSRMSVAGVLLKSTTYPVIDGLMCGGAFSLPRLLRLSLSPSLRLCMRVLYVCFMCMNASIHVYNIYVYEPTHTHLLCVCVRVRVSVCVRKSYITLHCMHTYIQTYVRAYIHTYIQTYIHTLHT